MKKTFSYSMMFFGLAVSFFTVALNNGFFYTLTVLICNYLNETLNILNKNYELSDLKWFVFYGYGLALATPTFFILKKIICTLAKIRKNTKSKTILFFINLARWIFIYYIGFSITSFIFMIAEDLFSIEELCRYAYKYTHDNLGWYTSEAYDFDPFFADLLLFTFIVFPLISCYFTSKSIKKHIKGTDYPSGSGYDL